MKWFRKPRWIRVAPQLERLSMKPCGRKRCGPCTCAGQGQYDLMGLK